MSQFVEECRREWKRLGVPDPVANEMAADLEADLKEAEAEGASAEDVLGSGAFDPRSFAASWAAERGVAQRPAGTEEPPPQRRARRAPLIALAVFALIAIVGATLAVDPFRSDSARLAVPAPLTRPIEQRIWAIPDPAVGSKIIGPAEVMPVPGPIAQTFAMQVSVPGDRRHTVGLILLLVGAVGVILSMLYWLRRPPLATRSW